MERLKRYLLNVLIGVDQLVNAIVLGDPDETMSSRFGKWMKEPQDTLKFKIAFHVCLILHIFDPDHCRRVIEHDEGKDDLL